MSILDLLFRRTQEAEEAAFLDEIPEETYVNGELVPGDEIVTEGEGDAVLPTLRKGNRGEDVKLLQTTLNEQGYSCGNVDGIFGKNTQKAVKEFQKAKGLSVDGIVGRKTWTALGLMEPEPHVDFVQPPNFKQGDSRWGKKMYSNHNDKAQTMASSGCGPTAMADIVAEWWDKAATPWTMAQLSMEWGTRTYDSGTSSTFFRKVQAKYNAAKYVTTSSLDTARDCLTQGGYVVVCFGPGSSSKPGYKKWTKGGHYCTMWGYDGDTYFINDPASSSSSRAKGTKAEIQNCRKGFYCFWR